MTLGKRIQNLRKEHKMSQQDLADKLFVTDKTISSWEVDRTEPSLDIIIKISELFECSVSYLIYGEFIKSDIETEIQIKLSLEEYERLNSYMKEKAEFINETKQKDTYYQPTHRKFVKGDVINEWLRIGERGNKKILTYKNWHGFYGDEYEVEIDNIENLKKISKILGLEEIAIVEKLRKQYFYLDKYSVALDCVEKLGYFIEIEVKKYDKTIMEEYDDLIKIARQLKLNLENINKKGYPYHLISFNNNDI